jgi:hypothetical protein
MRGDRVYFAKRAVEERSAATAAVEDRSRKAHLAMAERYDDLSAAIGRSEQQLGLILPSAA